MVLLVVGLLAIGAVWLAAVLSLTSREPRASRKGVSGSLCKFIRRSAVLSFAGNVLLAALLAAVQFISSWAAISILVVGGMLSVITWDLVHNNTRACSHNLGWRLLIGLTLLKPLDLR